MTVRLQLSTQIAMAIFIALILGYLFQKPAQEVLPADTATPVSSTLTATPSATEEVATPQPFVTLTGVWMVRVVVYRDAAPEIVKVAKLSQGRLTISQLGDSYLRVLDEAGIILYELAFQPHFHVADAPIEVDDNTYFFIIPSIENAHLIQVITPQGESTYEFPNDG